MSDMTGESDSRYWVAPPEASSGADGFAFVRVEKNAKVVEKLKLDFPILSDPELKAIKAFGLLHEGGYRGETPDIARPGVFILDRKGVVRWRHLTDNWRKRVRPETVLEHLAKIR